MSYHNGLRYLGLETQATKKGKKNIRILSPVGEWFLEVNGNC